MKNFMQFREDLASGRPAKKPVSSSLLKNMAKDNEKAIASGFMKLSPKERAKESKRLGEDNYKAGLKTESARDNYNPEISDKRTKEKLKKAGLPPESPKVMEAKKPIVHSTKKDSLKMIKIKYNSPIKTKVTDIGAGGKEYVRKDWSEGYTNKGMKADEKEPNTLPKMDAVKRLAAMRADRQKPNKKPAHGIFSEEKKEKFVPHDMWDENGKKHFAKTEIKHLAMKAKGWSHDNPNKEEQIQLVTNLDFNEGIVTLVNRGLSKVRDSIKSAEKTSGYKVDPSKNNTNNPVSGDNIRKRLASQKKR